MLSVRSHEPNNLWGVVLTGSLDERHRHHHRVPGAHHERPRRHRAVFRQAVERATWLVPTHRLVAVLARDHSAYYDSELEGLGRIQKVVQPAWRGSAAELFLPILKIASADPDATVAIFPGRQAMDGETQLMTYVAKAVQAITLRPDLPIVLGAVPQGPDATHAWIDPGGPIEGLEAYALRAVRRFVARPSRAEAATLWAADGLINTHVVVAKARTIIALGGRYLPDVLEAFEPLGSAFGTPEESLLCEAVYEGMPYASMAHALFVRNCDIAVLPAPHVRVTLEAPVVHALAS
jgi:mannose-1-phosphate guanylyltransferase